MTSTTASSQTSVPPRERNARIFLSCGQRANTDEVQIARVLSKELEKLGFLPYLAVREQSLRSLRENIFERLKEFEYFLFIDFTREPLAPDGVVQDCRGSLFSNQELAIASFQDMPIIAFQESGVKRLDGLIGHLQTNCTAFTERTRLVSAVLDRVKAEWTNDWQNRLEITLTSDRLGPRTVKRTENGRIVRWAFLTVLNRHRWKAAQDCFGYLVAAQNISTGQEVPFESAEQKWSGYVYPSARISPSSKRRLDAFYIAEDDPLKLCLPCFADSTEFIPQIKGKGPWLLTYEVVSQNLSGDRISIAVSLDDDLNRVKIEWDDLRKMNLSPSDISAPSSTS